MILERIKEITRFIGRPIDVLFDFLSNGNKIVHIRNRTRRFEDPVFSLVMLFLNQMLFLFILFVMKGM